MITEKKKSWLKIYKITTISEKKTNQQGRSLTIRNINFDFKILSPCFLHSRDILTPPC
jgi:hypothetical protein